MASIADVKYQSDWYTLHRGGEDFSFSSISVRGKGTTEYRYRGFLIKMKNLNKSGAQNKSLFH